MRLATLGVAVILLVGMSPALAHGTQDAWDECKDEDCENGPYHSPENGSGVKGSHTINESVPYKENLTVENDAYLKAGWWADGSQADGLNLDLSNSDDPAQEEEKIMWVHIKPGRTMPSVPYEVTVETDGPVVAAMDVFRVYRGVDEGATWITPNCPQTLVEDLFPDEGEGAGFVFRVKHETTDYHQRSASVEGVQRLDGEMSVDLNPNRAPEGYIVAVYPQVAAANDNDEVHEGDTTIDLTVSISDGEFKLFDDRQDRQQPSEPYDTNNWVGVNDIDECKDPGIELPPPLSDSQAAEIPGQGGVEERVQALVGTSLEAAS